MTQFLNALDLNTQLAQVEVYDQKRTPGLRQNQRSYKICPKRREHVRFAGGAVDHGIYFG